MASAGSCRTLLRIIFYAWSPTQQLAYRRIEQRLGRKARPGDRAGGRTGWGKACIDAKLVNPKLVNDDRRNLVSHKRPGDRLIHLKAMLVQ